MWRSLLFCSVLVAPGLQAQQLLHFTGTSGYDHGTRTVSFQMFQSICAGIGCTVVDNSDGSAFSDPSSLAQYDVVVFSNTSGNNILNATQRANFEAWVNAGGHVMGIHAASDTYRHSTANGGNTGTWDFYAELIGASVQENPNHVDGIPEHAIAHIGSHPSTANLPAPWLKHEEYYYWEHGYFGTDNTVVLEVEETIGPNGQVNSYDAPRPMSWYRELPTGSLVFYTALGHTQSNYTDDVLFRQHVGDALAWMVGNSTGIGERQGVGAIAVFPNPASDVLHVVVEREHIGRTITLHDAMGRVVMERTVERDRFTLPMNTVATGSYVLRVGEQATAIRIVR